MATFITRTGKHLDAALIVRWSLVLAVLGLLGLQVDGASATPLIRIECLGDSITAGYTDNPTWSVPFGFGYRSGLYTRLTDAQDSFQFVGASGEPWNGVSGVPTTVSAPDLRTLGQDYHRGYGGQDANYLSSNIVSWLNEDKPDVVLLMVGINDIREGSTGNPLAAEGALDNLVATIVGQKPNAHLIVAQITPYASYTDSIVQYNSYIRDTLVPYYAGPEKLVSTVDQYSNFLSPNGTIDAGLYANGLNHPNAVGYDRMAETWFDGMRAVIPLPEPGTLSLLAVALTGVLAYAWRKRKEGRVKRQMTEVKRLLAALVFGLPALLGQVLPAIAGEAVLRADCSGNRPEIGVLSWDTEGGGRAETNLLRTNQPLGLRIRVAGQWKSAAAFPAQREACNGREVRFRLALADNAVLHWSVIPATDRLAMSFSVNGAAANRVEGMELAFPFDPGVTPTTVLPSQWADDGSLRLPAVLSAPDFGQMVLAEAAGRRLVGPVGRKPKQEDRGFRRGDSRP